MTVRATYAILKIKAITTTIFLDSATWTGCIMIIGRMIMMASVKKSTGEMPVQNAGFVDVSTLLLLLDLDDSLY